MVKSELKGRADLYKGELLNKILTEQKAKDLSLSGELRRGMVSKR